MLQSQSIPQQPQPNVPQQLNLSQNKPNNGQVQPNAQQNQSPIHQENANLPLNNFVPPPQNQMGPKLNQFVLRIFLKSLITFFRVLRLILPERILMKKIQLNSSSLIFK